MSDHRNDLKDETSSVTRFVRFCILLAHLGSAILSGASAWLFFDHQETGGAVAFVVALLIGVMTYAALASFSAAAVRILPRLGQENAALAGAIAGGGLVAILAVSGTSNATFLAHAEARALERQSVLAAAEAAFASVQTALRQLEQVLPILATGKETAARLKDHEERRGQTGAGRGPVYREMLVQESRLAGAEEGVREVVKAADGKVRAGQQTLESLRAALSDPEMGERDRVRAVENALTRLASVVIELRQQLPIASLKATANMLAAPVVAAGYSTVPETRRVQDETMRRLHREFEPIGIALRQAVTDLEDRQPKPVPTYRHLSPTAVVFRHAGELAWIIALGYALDLLPYLAVGLILLAHAQGRGGAPGDGGSGGGGPGSYLPAPRVPVRLRAVQ
ncbi:hypothetical protein EDC65_0054 [Stella humosa]|uniref:Uncharacterized protein n=1 Tax=Stella humosa TaxID=94 RepID=A0A3N1MI62_9PROT|nr:hypothetical protein [Stella humosa]ROQ03371.1 hypothetical protein EDC65_0054 [Stella humosa]BBK29659.1 hypothetical protein STHU_02930 [Stella humosa]